MAANSAFTGRRKRRRPKASSKGRRKYHG